MDLAGGGGFGRRRVGQGRARAVCEMGEMGCVLFERVWGREVFEELLFFLMEIPFAESREKGSRQRTFAEGRPVRLSAKTLCRGPSSLTLGKDSLPKAQRAGSRQRTVDLFLFFLNLELSFFLCPCDPISKYILKFVINLTFLLYLTN